MKPIKVLTIVACTIFLALGSAWAGIENHKHPRTANYFLDEIVNVPAQSLAPWDLLILACSRNQDHYLAKLDSFRFYNPDIVLLAYIQSCGVLSAAGSLHPERTYRLFYDKIEQEDWWLYDAYGERVGVQDDGEGGWVVSMINVCVDAPVDGNGDRFIDWFPGFVQENILSTGRWDGIFLDIVWEKISFLNDQNPQYPIDSNRDGVVDDEDWLDQRWGAGMQVLTDGLRDLVGDECLIMSNGNNTYHASLNGGMREYFPFMHGDWEYNIADPEHGYIAIDTDYRAPRTNVINAVWQHYLNTTYEPHQNYEFWRVLAYDLASTVVFGDGYFSFDSGEGGHRTFWWMDVYDIDLGDPLSDNEPVSATPGARPSDPWGYLFCQRRFENGVAVVNATEVTQDIHLSGVYYDALGYNGEFYNYHSYLEDVVLSSHAGGIFMSADAVPGAVDTVAHTISPGKPTLLEWDAVAGADKYAIYRAPYDGFYPDKAKLMGTTRMPRFADYDSRSDTTLYYIVSAISPGGFEGPYSEAVEVRWDEDDPGVSGHTDGEKINIRWSATPDYTYVIARQDDSGKWQRWRVVDNPLITEDGECTVRDSLLAPGKYVYQVYEVAPGGKGEMLIGRIEIDIPASPGVKVLESEVWPNPSADVFHFMASGPGPARAEIYDARGRLVRVLDDWNCSEGAAHWSGLTDYGDKLPSGTYFYRLSCGEEESRGKITLIR